MARFKASDLPEGFEILTDRYRKWTIAIIVDEAGICRAIAVAAKNPKFDDPDSLGEIVAVGRVVKQFFTEFWPKKMEHLHTEAPSREEYAHLHNYDVLP